MDNKMMRRAAILGLCALPLAGCDDEKVTVYGPNGSKHKLKKGQSVTFGYVPLAAALGLASAIFIRMKKANWD